MASATSGWKSREDYKKQRELEEARKAGTAAPETDEDGKEINPHIPQYIAQAPWYLNNSGPSLKHQRGHLPKPDYTKDWYQRGKKVGSVPIKFKKGACKNCGATTHTEKFCCERPRKVGAKWTNQDIQPDEVVQNLTLDYDGKRDRWNGYDPSTHMKVIEQYDKIEEERRKKKTEYLDKFMTEPHGKDEPTKQGDSDSDSGSDDNKEYKEDGSQSQVTKVDPKTRTTIRNLRIREDTAKYLRNLDLNSAYYDPKTRSMRENPNPSVNPDEVVYAGDNHIRNTGDSKKFNNMQYFAWEAYEKGQDLHIQGAPSQAELLFEQFKVKKEALKKKQKEQILSRYGGEEHLESLPKALLFSQTDSFTEFSRDGKAIKPRAERQIARSKYEEDVYINNHTSVWGSYWENGNWGYACCWQLVKNSYCTGKAGIEARRENTYLLNSMSSSSNESVAPSDSRGSVDSAPKTHKKKDKEKDKERTKEDKLKEAYKAEEMRQRAPVETDERKRPYNSLSGSWEVTEEEMEAYTAKKIHFEDPMRNFLKSS